MLDRASFLVAQKRLVPRNGPINTERRRNEEQSQRVDARAANMRRPQLELIRSKFMDAIQKYQTEEKAYRDKTKDRIARQYMIGK